MAFGSIGGSYQPKLFDFGAAFVQTTSAGARPAFELRFYNTQNAQLDKLQKEIEDIYARTDTGGATALLNTKVKSLESTLGQISDFKTRTDARIAKVTLVLEQLNDLNTLADPSSVAEFDAKLAETLDTVSKIEARPYEFFGVNDKVRRNKFDAISRLEAVNHNNFATQGDIDAVKAEITTMRNNFLTSQQIANTNANLAYTKHSSTNSRLSQIKGQIASLRIEANANAISEVQKRKEYYSELLSTLSLAFEASQNLTDFVAKNAVLPQKIDPGSVLNLFS